MTKKIKQGEFEPSRVDRAVARVPRSRGSRMPGVLNSREYLFAYRLAVLCDRPEQAYARAWPERCQRDGQIDRSIAYRNAIRATKDPRIMAAIQVLRESSLEAEKLTLSAHMGELRRIRDQALEANKLQTAAYCEVKRGEASGLYTKRLKIEHSSSSVEELEHQLQSLVAANPELAQIIDAAIGPDGVYRPVLPGMASDLPEVPPDGPDAPKSKNPGS